MTNEAKFTINGTPSEDPTTGDKKFIATNSQTLSITLEANPSAVLSVQYEVYDPTDSDSPLASKNAPLLTFVASGTSKQTFTNVNDTAQIVMPSSGTHSYFIRCRVGIPTDNGSETYERAVSILTSTGTSPELRKTVPAETTQARQRGFSDDLNEIVDHVEALGSGPGTGDVVGTPPSVTDAIARFSNTTAKLIKNSPILIKDDTGFTAEIQFFVGTRNPNGNVTGNPGDLYYRDSGTSSIVYIHQGTGSSNNDWNQLGAGVSGPVSSVINAVAVWNDTTGDSLENSSLSVSDDTGFTATSNMFIGSRSPVGNVTGNPGDFYIRADAGVNSAVYIHQGSSSDNTSWTQLGSGITGPSTTTDNGMLSWDGTTGTTVQDTKHRVYFGSDSRTIDVRDPNDTQWINVAYLERTAANGLPAGLWSVFGDANGRTILRCSSGTALYAQESNALGSTRYYIIYENVAGGWKINNPGILANQTGDTIQCVTLDNDGTNAADTRIFVGNRSPSGNISGYPGDIYIRSDDTTNSTIYIHQGSSSDTTSWTDLTAATNPGVAFSAYMQNDQGSILDSIALTVDFDSENYDDGSDYDTGTAKFVAPSNGYYTFSANIGITTTAAATKLECRLTKGVSTIIASNSRACSGSGTFYVSTACNGIKLSTSDEIRCKVWQNSGSAATVEADDSNFFGCQLWEI